MKLVSVIVPNFNHATFLTQRIESILAQDYPSFEVIVLDDCSSDDSMAILEAYRNNPHLRALVRNEKNSGNTFVQWRKGLSMAQGDYVWIAESDDVASPELLTNLVHLLEQPNQEGSLPVLAFSASEWIDSKGQSIPRTQTARWKRPFRMNGPEFATRFLTGYSYICNASAVVMRRDAALRVSDAYLQYRASGDRQFWIEMALQGDVCYTPMRLNQFRQHLQKVSAPAEKAGRNIVEDHHIYSAMRSRLALSRWRRHFVCGYHYHAITNGRLSDEGQRIAMTEWQNEREFGHCSHLIYLLSRLYERCRF